MKLPFTLVLLPLLVVAHHSEDGHAPEAAPPTLIASTAEPQTLESDMTPSDTKVTKTDSTPVPILTEVNNSDNDVKPESSGDKKMTGNGTTETELKGSETKGAPAAVVAKRDLKAAETGYGLGGFGGGIGGIGGAGYGGGVGHGGGYGGGFGGHNGFGGGKSIAGGNKFGADYGGINKNIKLVDDKHAHAQHATKGFKGNQGFHAQNGYAKNDAGHLNKANKKGHFGSLGHFSKAAKNDGTTFGKNNVATKFAKGTKFGAKGAHKKGHATKGFHNTHHKDEYSKNHAFHDEKNAVDFFDKFGDEGAFKNDLAGKQFFNGHHADVFNKNNQANQGTFLSGHHNNANKGHNSAFGNKGTVGHNNFYNQAGGQNFASGVGKGIHANNQHGGHFGGGFGGKQGGFGGSGYGSGGGFGGGHGGGYGGGGFGGGFGIGR